MTHTQQRVLLIASACTTFVATASSGATEHASAFLLRVLVAVFCITRWPTATTARFSHLMAPVCAVVVLSAALCWAPSFGVGLQAWISVICVCALYATLLVNEHDHAPMLFRIAVVVGVAHTAWAVVQTLTGNGRARGGFFNPNDLAAFLAPLCVWTAAQAQQQKRWLYVTGLLALGVLATASRSGLLALICSLAILALGRRIALVALGACLLGALAFSPLLRDRWLGKGDLYAYSRAQIWQSSLAVAKQALPAGVGLNFASEALRQHGVPLSGFVRYPRVATHAHSEPLNALVELGVAGAGIAMLPLAMLLASLYRRHRRGESKRAVRVDIALFSAFAIPALVSSSLHVPIVALLGAVWAAAVIREDPPETVEDITFNLGRHTRGTVLCVMVVAVLSALPGVAIHTLTAYASHLLAKQEVPQARDAMHLANAIAPWSQAARLTAARLDLRSGQPTREVTATLADIADDFPYSPSAPLLTAQLLAQEATTAEQWRIIASFLAVAARRDPRNALAWTELGRAYARAGKTQAARLAWGRALIEEPYCARALAYLSTLTSDTVVAARLRQRAQRAHERARFEEGRAREILSLDPDSASIDAHNGD